MVFDYSFPDCPELYPPDPGRCSCCDLLSPECETYMSGLSLREIAEIYGFEDDFQEEKYSL